ncbi:hypothetical protein TNCV_1129981 [Trichonephila clavipes]|nr:hypothetical protein TNCV_1129981 [Trichonephila clavipes]
MKRSLSSVSGDSRLEKLQPIGIDSRDPAEYKKGERSSTRGILHCSNMSHLASLAHERKASPWWSTCSVRIVHCQHTGGWHRSKVNLLPRWTTPTSSRQTKTDGPTVLHNEWPA